jgi:heptosyltransferase-2
MKILVVAPSWIGDAVMAQPLFARLHQQHRKLQLDVLAPGWCAPMLARMPEVRRVIESPFRHGEFGWSTRRRIAHSLTEEGYDQAIVLPNSWKSALVPLLAGIPRRTGYRGEARYLLLNDRKVLDRATQPQLVQRYAALAGPLDTQPLRPQLVSTLAQQAAARSRLGLRLDARPIIFCPGAEYGPAKRWPTRHFATLAAIFRGRGDEDIWLIGSAGDAAAGADIARLADDACRNLCGETSLDQAIDLIAGARLVVSNDSGLMHIAAALDRPLLAIYGSSSPVYTPPLSPCAKIVSLQLECSPCFKRECPLGHLNCLNELTPQRVLTAADELLR